MKTLLAWTRLAWPILACSALAPLSGCMRDGSFVSPGDKENMRVLAAFHGQSEIKDSAINAQRVFQITDPKVALVWQFVGPSSFGVAFDRISVSATSPFRFSVELRNPPPDSIAYSEDPAIGAFWLYSDANGNGHLDRITDPRVARHDPEIKALQAAFKRASDSLLEVANVSPIWVPYKDTFLLDSTGTSIHLVGGKLDTLYVGRNRRDTLMWNEVLFRRFRLLKNFNPWEDFFALRGKSQGYWLTATPTPEHSYFQVFENFRKLFPKPGREAEFESRLKSASLASLAYMGMVGAVQQEAADSGWVDYPYQGFGTPGSDWVVGKSRKHFVLYFPTEASMDRVVDAEKGGSFRVDEIDRLHLGYNLLECNDLYRCRVLSSEDPVNIELAQSDAYFNRPGAPVDTPITVFAPVVVAADSLKAFEGGYDYFAYRPITVRFRAGTLWCNLPYYGGIHRLVPAGRNMFFAPGSDVQFEFIRGRGGVVSKLLVYREADRDVATANGTEGDRAWIDRAIDSILSLQGATFPDSLRTTLPASFAYGRDTLRASCAADARSITLTVPNLPSQTFLPENASQGFDPSSGNRLAVVRNGIGRISGIRLTRQGEEIYLPAIGYVPRKPAEVFGDTGTTPAGDSSGSDGSFRDTYVGLASQHRYACAEDGLYLGAGDGWVVEVRHGQTGDDISLRDPGDGLVLGIKGKAGKRLKLRFTVCGQKAGKQGRVLLELRGGASAQGPFPDLISEADWVRPGEKGATLEYAPIPIPTDPYYLEVGKVHTWDDSLYFSFEDYQSWSD